MSATSPLIMVHAAESESEPWQRLYQILDELDFAYIKTTPDESLSFSASSHLPDTIISSWNDHMKMEVHALKHDEALYRIPVFVVSDDPGLENVAMMINAGAEDCIHLATPDILVKSRICNALKTKFYYDYVLEMARDDALRDPLTGLWNHRQFHELLRTEIAKHKRTSEPVTVMMLDLDRFKKINDTYGHPIGDQVITESASILKSVLRPGDVVARYGGEEFGLVLPGVDRAYALEVGERIRESVQQGEITVHGRRIPMSVSVGFAIYPEDASDASSVVQIADMALLQAKARGRNRIETVRRIAFHHRMPEKAEFLGIGGNWNAWIPEHSPLALVSSNKKGDLWEGHIVLPTGKNKYKFMLRYAGVRPQHECDHMWFPDDDNPSRESDGFGGWNSILSVDPY